MKRAGDFRLMTEEAFRCWLTEHPERQKSHFQGYCTITETAVEYDSGQGSEHNCNNCYPESHFIMVPNAYL